MGADKKTFDLDGARFDTLETFYGEVSQVLIPGYDWGRNLDAFNDILRGGFGTPEGGFIIVWRNSQKSRGDLGYDETVRQLINKLEHCHPTNRELVASELALARRSTGSTVFDWLVDIISGHHEIDLVLA